MDEIYEDLRSPVKTRMGVVFLNCTFEFSDMTSDAAMRALRSSLRGFTDDGISYSGEPGEPLLLLISGFVFGKVIGLDDDEDRRWLIVAWTSSFDLVRARYQMRVWIEPAARLARERALFRLSGLDRDAGASRAFRVSRAVVRDFYGFTPTRRHAEERGGGRLCEMLLRQTERSRSVTAALRPDTAGSVPEGEFDDPIDNITGPMNLFHGGDLSENARAVVRLIEMSILERLGRAPAFRDIWRRLRKENPTGRYREILVRSPEMNSSIILCVCLPAKLQRVFVERAGKTVYLGAVFEGPGRDDVGRVVRRRYRCRLFAIPGCVDSMSPVTEEGLRGVFDRAFGFVKCSMDSLLRAYQRPDRD